MFQPIAGKICVELVTERQTSPGLFLPETKSTARVIKGKVVAVGKPITIKDKTIGSPCNVGDTAFFKRLGTEAFTKDDKDYYFPKFEDVLMFVKG